MKADTKKVALILANQCKSFTDLRATGMAPSTISKIIKGGEIRGKTMGRLAAALGVQVEDILEV